MDLDTVADDLYALAPSDFTAARNERARIARSAGDRKLAADIAALRRPTLSAWASNLLVRSRPEQVGPLTELGEALRSAHRELDGEQLRELSRRQRAVIAALSRQARQLTADAGHRVSEETQREVEETLHAVLADPQAAQEWSAGRLARPLAAPTGFAPAGVQEGGLASPRPARKPPGKRRGRDDGTTADLAEAQERRTQRRQQLARARERAREAERELWTREQRHTAARDELGRAQQAVTDVDRRLAELNDQVRRVQAEQGSARRSERTARSRLRVTERAVRQARKQAADTAAHAEALAAEER